MDKNKKEQTFKDLFSNIKENDSSISFNAINQISKEDKKEETLNNLFAESNNDNNTFKSILDEAPNLIEKEEKVEEPNPFLNETPVEDKKEEKVEEVNPFLNEAPIEDKKEEESNPFLNEAPIEEVKNEIPEQNIFKDKEEPNPLLNSTPIEEEKNIIPEEEIEEEPIDNPFLNDTEETKEEEKENIKDVLDENPFFIDNEETEEVLEKQLVDDKINLVENKKYEISNNDTSKIDTSNTKHFNVKIVKKKDPPLKFLIGVLSYAVFIWLLLIGIALLVYVADIKIRAAKGDTSSPTFNAYVVLSGSMLPEIQVYDVVVTKKIDVKDLKEGDVITFASSDTRFLNTIITHRILKKYYDSEKKQYTFQTKGDNNNVADSALVQQNNIFGKVILKIPKLGYLQEFLASRGGWIIVILLPCLAVISYDVVKLAKGLKRKKYKNIKVQK